MRERKDASSPAAIAYALVVLARAEKLGFPPDVLTRSQRTGSGGSSPVVHMRAAVAYAVERAGIGIAVFRSIAATRAHSGRFRDALYRRELLTADVEATIAALTKGLAYTPPRPARKPQPAAAPVRPTAPARFHHLGPNAFEDSAAAQRTGTIGQAPRPETWVPPVQEW